MKLGLLLTALSFVFSALPAFADDAADDVAYEAELQALAAEGASVHIECDLRSIGLSCEQDVINAFFTANPDIKRAATVESSMIQIKVTDENAKIGTLVHLTWSSTDRLSATDFRKDLQFINQDTDMRRATVLKVMAAGVGGYLKILESVETGGKLTITYDVGSNGEGDTKPKKTYDGPFYINFNLNGSTNKSGIGAVNADGTSPGEQSSSMVMGSGAVNYSTKKVRLKLSGYNISSHQNVPDGQGGQIKANQDAKGLNLLTVYSLGNSKSAKPLRWSMIMIASDSASESSNIHGEQSLSAGVEYILVPFRTDQNHEFTFQLGTSANRLNLIAPNGLGHLNEKFMSAMAKISLYWLLDHNKVSVSSSLSGSNNLKYKGYYGYRGDLSFSYQINSNVNFSASGNYDYLAKSISFQGDPSYTNALQTQFQGGNNGSSYGINLGVGVTLFNSLLNQRDRRGSY